MRWLLLTGVALGAPAFFWWAWPTISSSSRPLRSSLAGHAEESIEEATGESTAEPPRASIADEAPPLPAATGRAKAVVEVAEHDFGVMDVGQGGQHVFVIRNEGNAQLTLRPAGTSCKCTFLDMPDGKIPPRSECQVRLEWTTQEQTENYRHGAMLWTNDPQQPQLRLLLVGKVRSFLACSAPSIVFSDVLPHDWRTQSVTVYSQVWNEFNIRDIASTLPNVTWQIKPADAETLASFHATSGYTLELTLDPDLPRGTFLGKLRLHAEGPATGPALPPEPIELVVTGNKLGPFSLYGPIIDSAGFLDLGTLPAGRGTRKTIFLHVRGEHGELEFPEIRATPDYLQVRISRDTRFETRRTRYAIEIEVPRDAPISDHMGANMGRLEITTNHPEVPRIELGVQFAVHP